MARRRASSSRQVRGLHGLHGAVRVEVLTDQPEARFAAGDVLHLEGDARPLTIVAAQAVEDGPGWRLRFREVPDRAGRGAAARGVPRDRGRSRGGPRGRRGVLARGHRLDGAGLGGAELGKRRRRLSRRRERGLRRPRRPGRRVRRARGARRHHDVRPGARRARRRRDGAGPGARRRSMRRRVREATAARKRAAAGRATARARSRHGPERSTARDDSRSTSSACSPGCSRGRCRRASPAGAGSAGSPTSASTTSGAGGSGSTGASTTRRTVAARAWSSARSPSRPPRRAAPARIPRSILLDPGGEVFRQARAADLAARTAPDPRLPALRGRRRPHPRPRRPRAVDRRLRAERRRARRARRRRRRQPACSRARSTTPRRVEESFSAGPPGVPAVHAAGRVPRPRRAGRAGERPPRGRPPLAPRGLHRADPTRRPDLLPPEA